jgi:hypothetical protein
MISINITTHPELGDVAGQVAEAMAALGFVRKTDESWSIKVNREDAADAKAAVAAYSEFVEKGGTPLAEVASELSISSGNAINKPDAIRKRGEPSPGKSRRTKAEIAEDDADDKADAERDAAATEAGIQANSADDVKPAISTGENRIGPDDEQDDADEAAEVEANRKGLTHDDLRQAVGRYQKKFGMAAAVAGIPALLGCAIVEVAEADLAAAIAKVDNAVAGDAPGPVEDAVPVVADKPVKKAVTKDDVMAAMLRYAKKFDGQNTDMNAMPNTMEDAPKIFGLLFGKDVVKLSQVPADGYAKTVAAFDEAIAKDPFKRGAK